MLISKETNFVIVVLFFAAFITLNPVYTFAAPASPGLGNVDTVLQNIVSMMTGKTARLIATICVAAVGIGWMAGFIDLRKTSYCIFGIGVVFGAPSVVGKLMGT